MNATALALYNTSPDNNAKTSPDATGRSGMGSIDGDDREEKSPNFVGGGGSAGMGKRPFHLQYSDIEPRF